MIKRRSIEEKISDYQPKLPIPVLYDLLRIGMRLYSWRNHILCTYHFDPAIFHGKQVIVLADHAVFNSFVPVIGRWRGSRFSIVTSSFFCSSYIGLLFCKMFSIIPKSLYENDYRCMRQMLTMLRLGASLLIFPEGMWSMSGSSMPLYPGTVSFLKGVKLPVILARSYGMYLSQPPYSMEKHKGHAELHYEVLFTPEELQELDEETLYQKLLARFRYNDFEWNAQHHYRYKTKKGNAVGLEKLLYYCPCCGMEQMMRSERDDLFCTSCGNRIRVEDDYRLIPAPGCMLPYENIDEWEKAQRRKVREEIESPDFFIEYDCRLYYSNPRSLNLTDHFIVAGEGHLRIDADGIRYRGTSKGQTADFFFNAADTPSFYVTQDSRYNILADRGVWYRFEPLSHDVNLYKNRFAVEEIHNKIDPAWNRVSRDAYDI